MIPAGPGAVASGTAKVIGRRNRDDSMESRQFEFAADAIARYTDRPQDPERVAAAARRIELPILYDIFTGAVLEFLQGR